MAHLVIGPPGVLDTRRTGMNLNEMAETWMKSTRMKDHQGNYERRDGPMAKDYHESVMKTTLTKRDGPMAKD